MFSEEKTNDVVFFERGFRCCRKSSVLDFPKELLCDILNRLPLNSFINVRLINKFFLVLVNNNYWDNHFINFYCGEEKNLEFLLDNFNFCNFRLEALYITDELAQKLAKKTLFIRFVHCTMAIKNIDILDQIHCYAFDNCCSLFDCSSFDCSSSNEKHVINNREICISVTDMSEMCSVFKCKKHIGIKSNRKVCNKTYCERKYCKFLKNEIGNLATIPKNILPFLDEIVVDIYKFNSNSNGYSYKENIIYQAKRYESYVPNFFINDDSDTDDDDINYKDLRKFITLL
jgi:hypothetical protein